MLRRLAPILAVLVALAVPSTAAAQRLSMAHARRAITHELARQFPTAVSTIQWCVRDNRVVIQCRVRQDHLRSPFRINGASVLLTGAERETAAELTGHRVSVWVDSL